MKKKIKKSVGIGLLIMGVMILFSSNFNMVGFVISSVNTSIEIIPIFYLLGIVFLIGGFVLLIGGLEKKFDSIEAYEDWAEEEARPIDNYKEAYQTLMGEHLDYIAESLRENRELKGGSLPPVVILKEAFKKALGNNEKGKKIIDNLYDIVKNKVHEQDKAMNEFKGHSEKRLELFSAYLTRQQIEDYKKRHEDPEYPEYTSVERDQVFRMISDKYGTEAEKLIRKGLDEGQSEVFETMEKVMKEVGRMGYGGGELVDKMETIKGLGFSAIDNYINYTPTYFTTTTQSVFSKIEGEKEREKHIVKGKSEKFEK